MKIHVDGCLHFAYCLKYFSYYHDDDKCEIADILLQLKNRIHLSFCTFCIVCSLDALVFNCILKFSSFRESEDTATF